MKIFIRSVFFGLVLGFAVSTLLIKAQERVTLTTPVAQPTITQSEIAGICMSRLPEFNLRIFYIDNANHMQTDEHSGVDAQQYVVPFNKANLSTTSLEKRAIQHLQGEGKIAPGSIVGSPQ